MTEAVPWVKWRFDKWRGDAGLRMCSLAARGLWIELISIMHGCDPYGHLAIKGRAPTIKQIAALVGMATEREIAGLLKELEEAGVFSRSETGLIYCRRLVRDNTIRAIGKSNGARGGNPLLTHGDKTECKGEERNGLREGVNPSPNPTLNPTLYPREREERERRESEIKPAASASATPRRFGGIEESVTRNEAGQEVWSGWIAEEVKEKVIEAAMLDDARWKGDFLPVMEWLSEGIDLQSIIAGIRFAASKERYHPPRSLIFFKGYVETEFNKLPPRERQENIMLAQRYRSH